MESIAAALLLEEENNTLQNLEAKLFEITDKLFQKNFRLNKVAFKYVLDTFTQESQLNPFASLTPLNRVVAALRFFAEGSYQHGVGADYNVGMAQSTVSRSLSPFLEIMEAKLCPQWIKFDQTEEEKMQAKQDFYSKAGFPGVTICVDGTHIKIVKPSKEENNEYDYASAARSIRNNILSSF